MKCVAFIAALLLGFTDWLVCLGSWAGVFFLLRQGGLDADGSFLGGMLVGAVFFGACAARLPGGRGSVNDMRLALLARIVRRAGWGAPHGTSRPPTTKAPPGTGGGPRRP